MSDGDIERLPVPDGPYPLGRHVWHDPRNRGYPIRAKLPPKGDITPRNRPWWRRGVYNQGGEGSCTAQAAAGVVETSPFRLSAPQRGALPAYDDYDERSDLYREAQRHDPWPGEDYSGSSTDAPFKVLRMRGHIAEWRWCFGMDDIDDTLDAHGPVAVGVRWHEGDFQVDSQGFIRGLGAVVGGHAFDVIYRDWSDDRYRCVNSWDRQWGDNGRFWITRNELGDRIDDRGEAVTVVL